MNKTLKPLFACLFSGLICTGAAAAEPQVINIKTDGSSMVMSVTSDGEVLFHHFGGRIDDATPVTGIKSYRRTDHGTDNLAYSTMGGRNFREPALRVTHADGDMNTELRYVSHTTRTLAAIVFGIVIALNVQACGVSEKKAVARSIMKAGVIAGAFLFTVYGLLAWLGARGSAVLAQAADGTAVLSGLCLQFFGPVGALLLAAIFFVACFNVCTGLLSSCAAFFHEKFPRFSFIRWLQAFTVVSFLVSILGLELILKISVPILTLLYPVAIAIIVINLLPFAWAQKPVVHRVVTVLAFAVSIWSMF